MHTWLREFIVPAVEYLLLLILLLVCLTFIYYPCVQTVVFVYKVKYWGKSRYRKCMTPTFFLFASNHSVSFVPVLFALLLMSLALHLNTEYDGFLDAHLILQLVHFYQQYQTSIAAVGLPTQIRIAHPSNSWGIFFTIRIQAFNYSIFFNKISAKCLLKVKKGKLSLVGCAPEGL